MARGDKSPKEFICRKRSLFCGIKTYPPGDSTQIASIPAFALRASAGKPGTDMDIGFNVAIFWAVNVTARAVKALIEDAGLATRLDQWSVVVRRDATEKITAASA